MLPVLRTRIMASSSELETSIRAASQPKRESIRKLTGQDKLFIMGLFLSNPTLYLHEVCQEVEHVFCKLVSPATICRLLAKYGMTRKKVQQVAIQCSVHYQEAYLAQMTCYSSRQLVWVDETGCSHRDHIHKFGYAIRSETQFTIGLYIAFPPLQLWCMMASLLPLLTPGLLIAIPLQTLFEAV